MKKENEKLIERNNGWWSARKRVNKRERELTRGKLYRWTKGVRRREIQRGDSG